MPSLNVLPSLTVVTPWLDHRELERDYWAAMRGAQDVEVLVIDNGSTPPLPNAWRLDENVGYAGACNAGLALARTDAVCFLNNDIAAVPHEVPWDRIIKGVLKPGVIFGAQIRYDHHGSVDDIPLPYLDGWCIAGIRADLLELGGFDEGYEEPAYYVDNDLCLRARLAGMTLRQVPVPLVHKLNGTTGRGDPEVARVTAANQLRFRAFAREALSEVMA